MASTLFPQTTSPVEVNTFKKLMTSIAAAGDAGLTVPETQTTKIVSLYGSYFEKTAPDAEGNIVIRLSTAGSTALAGTSTTEKPAKAPKPVLEFKIEEGFTPAAINRQGARTSTYPFDSMAVGQSFFIAATDAMPEPAKKLASTVSAATRRYSVATGKTKADGKPEKRNTREYTIRAVTENGVKGARIYRVADKAAPVETATATA